MRVYISGPVTDATPEQLENFALCEEDVQGNGHTPVNPLTIVGDYAEMLGIASDDVAHEEAMRLCIGALLTCDMVHLLPGIEYSEGALLEMAVAQAVGMEVEEWSR